MSSAVGPRYTKQSVKDYLFESQQYLCTKQQ